MKNLVNTVVEYFSESEEFAKYYIDYLFDFYPQLEEMKDSEKAVGLFNEIVEKDHSANELAYMLARADVLDHLSEELGFNETRLPY